MPTTPSLSRAQRLDALVRKVAPKAAAHYDKTGKWPPNDDGKVTAPYVIVTTKDNGRRIRLSDDDGGVISVAGATLEDALTALEAKVK